MCHCFSPGDFFISSKTIIGYPKKFFLDYGGPRAHAPTAVAACASYLAYHDLLWSHGRPQHRHIITNFASLVKGCGLHVLLQELGGSKLNLDRLYELMLPVHDKVNLPCAIDFRHIGLPQDVYNYKHVK